MKHPLFLRLYAFGCLLLVIFVLASTARNRKIQQRELPLLRYRQAEIVFSSL